MTLALDTIHRLAKTDKKSTKDNIYFNSTRAVNGSFGNSWNCLHFKYNVITIKEKKTNECKFHLELCVFKLFNNSLSSKNNTDKEITIRKKLEYILRYKKQNNKIWGDVKSRTRWLMGKREWLMANDLFSI